MLIMKNTMTVIGMRNYCPPRAMQTDGGDEVSEPNESGNESKTISSAMRNREGLLFGYQ